MTKRLSFVVTVHAPHADDLADAMNQDIDLQEEKGWTLGGVSGPHFANSVQAGAGAHASMWFWMDERDLP